MFGVANPTQIFVSYSAKDRGLVEKIHLALEAAGGKAMRVGFGAIKWKRL